MTDIHSMRGKELPGTELDAAKMPGHWLLARLGKRVLRPGGLKLTRELLDALAIGPGDDVVEFAPGLGVTARMILQHKPQRYTGIERDAKAAQWTRRRLSDPAVLRRGRTGRSYDAASSIRIRCYWRGHVEHADGRAQAPDRG